MRYPTALSQISHRALHTQLRAMRGTSQLEPTLQSVSTRAGPTIACLCGPQLCIASAGPHCFACGILLSAGLCAQLHISPAWHGSRQL